MRNQKNTSSDRGMIMMSSLVRWYPLVIFMSLPTLISSQGPANPTASNCLALPCIYKGECRAASGDCGDTNEFCNDNSIWIPICGGGANLDKEPEFDDTLVPPPQPIPQPISPPPPTNEPVMMPTSLQNMMDNPTTKSPQAVIQIESPSDVQQEVAAAVITSSPTTAWQAWIGQENKDDEQSGPNQGTNNKNETTNNQPDWFTDVADNWDERYNKTEQNEGDNGDGGFFDSIGNWFDGNSATTCSLENKMMALVATVMMAWIVK